MHFNLYHFLLNYIFYYFIDYMIVILNGFLIELVNSSYWLCCFVYCLLICLNICQGFIYSCYYHCYSKIDFYCYMMSLLNIHLLIIYFLLLYSFSYFMLYQVLSYYLSHMMISYPILSIYTISHNLTIEHMPFILLLSLLINSYHFIIYILLDLFRIINYLKMIYTRIYVCLFDLLIINCIRLILLCFTGSFIVLVKCYLCSSLLSFLCCIIRLLNG